MASRRLEARKAMLSEIDQSRANLSIAQGAFDACKVNIAMQETFTAESAVRLGKEYLEREIAVSRAAKDLASKEKRRADKEIEANHVIVLGIFLGAVEKGNNVPLKTYLFGIGQDNIDYGKSHPNEIDSMRMIQTGQKYVDMSRAIPVPPKKTTE